MLKEACEFFRMRYGGAQQLLSDVKSRRSLHTILYRKALLNNAIACSIAVAFDARKGSAIKNKFESRCAHTPDSPIGYDRVISCVNVSRRTLNHRPQPKACSHRSR